MKNNQEMNKPVTILTGFLGSGKTTFLNHVLQGNKDIRYAIIENEFGEEGIDNELVLSPDDTIVELNNGCLCCTLNDNLYDILNELHERRDEFDELIIEATGVADPRGLAQPFISHPLIKKHFPVKAIICLVDSELVEDQIVDTEEAINQITFSDILLLNKVDLISEEYVEVLESRLQKLNPLARIAKGHKDQFPKVDFSRNNDKIEDLLLDSKNDSGSDSSHASFPVQKPHRHHHDHKHTDEVNSQSFIFDTPFDFSVLHVQLTVYLTFQSKKLYRMKGLIWGENEDQQFSVQSVGKRLDFQEKRAWEANEQRQSVIVFIGKNLQRHGLERMLKMCLSKSKSQPKKDLTLA